MDKVAKPPEEKGGRTEFKRDQAPGMGVPGGGGGKKSVVEFKLHHVCKQLSGALFTLRRVFTVCAGS